MTYRDENEDEDAILDAYVAASFPGTADDPGEQAPSTGDEEEDAIASFVDANFPRP